MKKIKIEGKVYYYVIGDHDPYIYTMGRTGFYSLEFYKRRKYIFFGKKIAVSRYVHKFTVYKNIENPKYTKEQIQEFIQKELVILNRKKEIEKGNII
jgi:hypothetical protein